MGIGATATESWAWAWWVMAATLVLFGAAGLSTDAVMAERDERGRNLENRGGVSLDLAERRSGSGR